MRRPDAGGLPSYVSPSSEEPLSTWLAARSCACLLIWAHLGLRLMYCRLTRAPSGVLVLLPCTCSKEAPEPSVSAQCSHGPTLGGRCTAYEACSAEFQGQSVVLDQRLLHMRLCASHAPGLSSCLVLQGNNASLLSQQSRRNRQCTALKINDDIEARPLTQLSIASATLPGVHLTGAGRCCFCCCC